VIGGGIGGLTAAAALKRKGWAVRVLEQAVSLEPVGSGLAIGPNGLRALDVLGIGDPVRARARFAGNGGLRTAGGSWLSKVNAELGSQRYGDLTVVLMRSVVVDLLLGLLSDAEIVTQTTVTSVSAQEGIVRTTAGEERADLVVAADGIRSGIRQALFPDHPGPVYSGITAWRLLAEGSGDTFGETWGRGLVFGVNPITEGRVYCYATAVLPAGERADSELGELSRLFGAWHDPIPGLLAAAEPGSVLRNDVWWLERPLPALHAGQVAVLGDAAHAMTPNLGQGACQAMEDAIVLAHEVTDGGGLPAYTAARLPRTTAIARQSFKVARMTTVRGPVGVALRNAVLWGLGRLGPNVLLRQGDMPYNWRPPASFTAAGPPRSVVVPVAPPS
jgi:2-polyprenyl-6-methoxyphenol hydroxylase-like FAD-dependent oxidoreductase